MRLSEIMPKTNKNQIFMLITPKRVTSCRRLNPDLSLHKRTLCRIAQLAGPNEVLWSLKTKKIKTQKNFQIFFFFSLKKVNSLAD